MEEYMKAGGRLGQGEGRSFVWLEKQKADVHLFWQTETTGLTHSGTGASAEIRVKCEGWRKVQECVLTFVCVSVCERAPPQVSKAMN